MKRDGPMHTWPAFRKRPSTDNSSARTRSASAHTMTGECPPSSNVTRLKSRLANPAISLPTAVEPVRETFRMIGDRIRCRDTSAGMPKTILTTPGGRPTCSQIFPNARAVPGVSSAGLRMIEQPAASACAIFRAGIMHGKFHGAKAATGPTGSCSTSVRVSGNRLGTMRPYMRRLSSASHSIRLTAVATSPRASARGLPCSKSHHLRQILGSLAQQRRHGSDEAGPLLRQHLAPLAEPALGSFQGAIEIRRRGEGYAADFLAGRRVDHGTGLPATALRPFAVDEEGETVVHGRYSGNIAQECRRGQAAAPPEIAGRQTRLYIIQLIYLTHLCTT